MRYELFSALPYVLKVLERRAGKYEHPVIVTFRMVTVYTNSKATSEKYEYIEIRDRS